MSSRCTTDVGQDLHAGGPPATPAGPPRRWALLVSLTLLIGALAIAAYAVTFLPGCADQEALPWGLCLDRGHDPRIPLDQLPQELLK